MTSIDYNTINPDEDKPTVDYHYTERRAEILRLIFKVGTPKRLDTKQLSDRYGVTRRTIYHDFDALAEFIEESLGTKATARTQALYERVIDELLSDGDWRAAWQTTMEWNQWLVDRGALDKVPERTELDARVAHSNDDQTESYRIVSAKDETIEVDGELTTVAESDDDGD